MTSILGSVKKKCNVDPSSSQFDSELIMDTNSVLMELCQMGLGPADGYFITDDTDLWTDFIEDLSLIRGIETYVGLKVRMMFDPPASSSAVEVFKDRIKELEWRLWMSTRPGVTEDE